MFYKHIDIDHQGIMLQMLQYYSDSILNRDFIIKMEAKDREKRKKSNFDNNSAFNNCDDGNGNRSSLRKEQTLKPGYL